MVTIEIRINGTLILNIYSRNHSELGNKSRYLCEVYEVEKGEVKTFKVIHQREDGLSRLIEKILWKYNRHRDNIVGKTYKKTLKKI